MLRRRCFTASFTAAMTAPPAAAAPVPLTARRFFQAQYGLQMRTHREMLEQFGLPQQGGNGAAPGTFQNGEEFARAALPLLERVEDRLALWKRQKWEFRTPAMLTPDEKVAATALLRKLQASAEAFGEKRRLYLRDSAEAAAVLSVSEQEMRLQPRAWLQKRVAALRMQGRSDDAKRLREAWDRMEALGGPDYDLLERLVLVYGLGKMGTFDQTFRNTICLAQPDNASGSGSGAAASSDVSSTPGLLKLDDSDALTDLLRLILRHIPDIHILYDFLGWNNLFPHTAHAEQTCYAHSLGEYMARCLQYQHGGKGVIAAAIGGNTGKNSGAAGEAALLYSNNEARVYLMKNPPQALGVPDAMQTKNGANNIATASSAPSFALWAGSTLTLIQQAHPNKYLRQHQLPNKRQLEGMCRRTAFVLGHSLDDVRARTLLLPPASMDRRSLLRLHAALSPNLSIAYTSKARPGDAGTAEQRAGHFEAELLSPELSAQQAKSIPPEFRGWVSLYRADLPAEDVDYQAVSEVKPEEEWIRL